MKYFDAVIRNGVVVTSSWAGPADVCISGEKIAAVTVPGENAEGDGIIDASGKLVVPGGVDMHVHLEMDAGPDLRSADDFYTGTRAAAYGGTTTIVDFVEPDGDETLTAALAARKAAAEEKALIDYGFHMTIGPEQMDKLEELPRLRGEGIGSCKFYMAYDLRLRDGELLRALQAAGDAGMLPVVHAENWDIITELTQLNIASGRAAPEWHPKSRPTAFEAEAVSRILTIADYAGVPLHIFHISCSEALRKVTEARVRGVRVTAETCPQYLFLSEDLHRREGVDGALPVCAPPLRSKEEQEGMWGALSRGEVQVISSDHCPFSRAEKESGMQRFDTIPGGVPSIELRYPLLYSKGVRRGGIGLQEWVRMCATAPARLAGLSGKGDIAPGFDADIVIFNPDTEYTVSNDVLHEGVDWTPYEGITAAGRAETVLSRGQIVIDNGSCIAEAGRGRYLKTQGI